MKSNGTSNKNNKKDTNKVICPFACPNCDSLGEYLKSRYEVVNILSDTGDSIFSPMHERYTEEHKSSIRKGKIFLSADLVDNLLNLNNRGFCKMSPQSTILNDWSDYWFYEIGANIVWANTKKKETYEKWSEYSDKSIPEEVHEARKKAGYYNKGIAVITGRLWRGPYTGKYLVAIDLDNPKAIEEFCRYGLEDLKQQTLVEQTANPDKMHVYFIVDREIPNKASDKVDISKSEKIQANEIPALEVKSNSKGIMFCSYSPHKNGSNYQIKGTLKPIVFNANDLENRISLICDKYGIPYGFNNNNSNGYRIPIEELWETETKILEGHNRHEALLRIMLSVLQSNKKCL